MSLTRSTLQGQGSPSHGMREGPRPPRARKAAKAMATEGAPDRAAGRLLLSPINTSKVGARGNQWNRNAASFVPQRDTVAPSPWPVGTAAEVVRSGGVVCDCECDTAQREPGASSIIPRL